MRPMTEAHFAILRRHMVEVIAIHAELAGEELGKAALDPRVLAAMADVPRHRFVPAPLAPLAYHDTPLPIGFDKTISQPFIVAVMTDLLAPLPTRRVLEVGTGLGYQTAVLARLARSGVERRGGRGVGARGRGAPAAARMSPTSASGSATARAAGRSMPRSTRSWWRRRPSVVPAALVEQLRPGGRMVLPLGGEEAQTLTVLDKDAAGQVTRRELLPVRFSRLETMA